MTLREGLNLEEAIQQAQALYQQRLQSGYDQAALDKAARQGFANGAFEDSEDEAFEELFRGTITQAPVYPREVVKLVLERNAAAIIMTHNHPSGDPAPSQQDIMLTRQLRDALALVDAKVLDHIVVRMEGCANRWRISVSSKP